MLVVALVALFALVGLFALVAVLVVGEEWGAVVGRMAVGSMGTDG